MKMLLIDQNIYISITFLRKKSHNTSIHSFQVYTGRNVFVGNTAWHSDHRQNACHLKKHYFQRHFINEYQEYSQRKYIDM